MNESVLSRIKPTKFNVRGRIWVGILLVIFLSGCVSYGYQLNNGLGITGLRDYASWGIYISNFVFFVAISLVGSLISAILYLMDIKWGIVISRIAEIIAVAAIIWAAVIIVVDMGRPDRLWHVLVYGRIQSPIVWDVLVVSTYLIYSVALLFLPMIPDLALLKENTESPFLKKLYGTLSLSWRGHPAQKRLLKESVFILSVAIIPIAFGIHTVTSWLFATTFRPGWDSTNFGPYFVSGAFLAGAAAVVIGMYVIRKSYHLEDFIEDIHFDKMGKLLVLLSLVYLYFNINEYLVPGYKLKALEYEHLTSLFLGDFALLFWTVMIVGMLIPTVILLFKNGRTPFTIFICALAILVGAWFKRYLIVTPTLLHPLLPISDVPDNYTVYFPTFPEAMITMGSLAGTLLIITAFIRFFPILPIYEIEQTETEMNVVEEKVSFRKTDTVLRTITLVVIMCLPFYSTGQEKENLRVNGSYIQEGDSMPYLTTLVRKRVGRKYEPVEGVIVNLFLNNESRIGMMGNIRTDSEGKGIFTLPTKFIDSYDTLDGFSFIFRILNEPSFYETREILEVEKSQLKFDFATIDSTLYAEVSLMSGVTLDQPVEGEQVFVYVKRLFGLLPVSTEYFITNGEGKVSVPIPGDLVADPGGKLPLVFKIEDSDRFGTLIYEAAAEWDNVVIDTDILSERTLWSDRSKAPIWLLIAANIILIGFWGAYVYIMYKAYLIYRFKPH